MEGGLEKDSAAPLQIIQPSILLPPMKTTLKLPTSVISAFISQLARIYIPDVLGTQSDEMWFEEEKDFEWGRNTDSTYGNGVDKVHKTTNERSYDTQDRVPSSDEEKINLLRFDEFERLYALKWLTGLIARANEWVHERKEDKENDQGLADDTLQRETVVERASALLAACSGPSASGAVTRTFTFTPKWSPSAQDSITSATTLHILLRDASLPSQDHTAVGLQTWGCAPILAKLIADSPQRFGLDLSDRAVSRMNDGDNVDDVRVLELGAGTGLLSILTWRLLEHQLRGHTRGRQCSVLATDFHESVLSNLRFNIKQNRAHPQDGASSPSSSSLSSSSARIEVSHLDWANCLSFSDQMRFDVVFGADIIYEPEHAALIKAAVEKTLKRPTPSDPLGGSFWLMYPLRPTHSLEIRTTEAVFGETVKVDTSHRDLEGAKEWKLGVVETHSLQRRKGIGKRDDISYRLLKIVWVNGS
ncbi:hypothetical protein FRC17_007152 [Serendipita sp. 399]|nr:hypothetical protein FRC17_007152 [Serendipita sp. 399]